MTSCPGMRTLGETVLATVGIMRFSALGDLASPLPLLRAMKTRPVIVTSPLGQALLADEFDDFVLLPTKRLRDVLRLIVQLRRRRLDLLVDFHNNDRSRFIRAFAGTRVIYLERNRDQHVSSFERSRQLLASAGLLGEIDLQFQPKPRNYIVLNTGSSPRWRSKRLPEAKWREIAAVLRARFNLPFVLTGSQDEMAYVAQIASAIGPAENRAGQTSLPELKRLLANAFLVVTTDSAALHIAATMKTPVVGIFGATNWVRSAPYGPWSTVVFDHAFYPDGTPPLRNRQECLNYYDQVDIREGLDRLAPLLAPTDGGGA